MYTVKTSTACDVIPSEDIIPLVHVMKTEL